MSEISQAKTVPSLQEILLACSGVLLLTVGRDFALGSPTGESPIAPTTANLARGLNLYKQACSSCHGLPKGEGRTTARLPGVPRLSSTRVQRRTDHWLFEIISAGVSGTAMRSFRSDFSERERWQIVAFVRKLPTLSSPRLRQLETVPQRSLGGNGNQRPR